MTYLFQPLASHALPLPSRVRLENPTRKHLKLLPIFPSDIAVPTCAKGLDSIPAYALCTGLLDRWELASITSDGQWHINATPSVPWTDDAIQVYTIQSNGLALSCGCHFLVSNQLYAATGTPSPEIDLSGMPELQMELWRYRIVQDDSGTLRLTPSGLQIGHGSYSRYVSADYDKDGPLIPITTTFKYPQASKGRGQDEDFPKERGPVLWEKDYDLAGTVFEKNATTHHAVSEKSNDAIADGEKRKVKLFKQFPAYYKEHAEIAGEETDTQTDEPRSEAKVGRCMESKTWAPFIKMGAPAHDDPRSKKVVSRCTCSDCAERDVQDSSKRKGEILVKPDLKQKCTVEERLLWQKTLPELAVMRAIDSPQTQYSNPELKQWHEDLSAGARKLVELKNIKGKIYKFLENDTYVGEDGKPRHCGMEVSVERFKQLGLWETDTYDRRLSGLYYPEGSDTVIPFQSKTEEITEIVETLALSR